MDTANAHISEPDKVMLTYVLKLTTEPWAVVERDVQLLREAGFNDEEILFIVQTTGYFALVNRIADGLGVELEPSSPAEEM